FGRRRGALPDMDFAIDIAITDPLRLGTGGDDRHGQNQREEDVLHKDLPMGSPGDGAIRSWGVSPVGLDRRNSRIALRMGIYIGRSLMASRGFVLVSRAALLIESAASSGSVPYTIRKTCSG